MNRNATSVHCGRDGAAFHLGGNGWDAVIEALALLWIPELIVVKNAMVRPRHVPHAAVFDRRARLSELAAQHKVPTIFPFLLPVTDTGGLMAFAVKASELHRQAAVYVDRVLKGAKPSDLPFQPPTQFELVINRQRRVRSRLQSAQARYR